MILDHVFTTIIALGMHEIHLQALNVNKYGPSKSPMAKTQTLGLISNIAFVPAHMEALYSLIAWKGGLKNIRSSRVSPMVTL